MPYLVYIVIRIFLQAHGETRPALIATLVANVVNATLCALLVRGDDALKWAHLRPLGLPRLGTLGAGLATSAGSIVLAAIILASVWRHKPAAAHDVVPLKVVFGLGLPIALGLVVETGIFSLLGLIVGRLGSHTVSAHQISLGLASFTFMGALGVAGATAVRVGHAVGAGVSPRRAGLLGLALGTCIMMLGALVFTLFPRWLVGLFTSDREVIGTGTQLLYIAAVFQLFDGLQIVAAGALRGAGDVRFAFLMSLTSHWLIGLPLALVLAFGLRFGVEGLWWGLTVGLATNSALLIARFLRITKGEIARV
jgi:MATE family multidrug resistance protein